MNAIYKIIGQDGQEYGPVTAEQIRQWIAEGRIESKTPIFVAGAKDWNFVGLQPEFAGCFAVSGTPPAIAPPTRNLLRRWARGKNERLCPGGNDSSEFYR